MKLVTLIFSLFIVMPCFAGPKMSKKNLETMGAKLGTDFKFSGLNISGRYKSASVGLATVEDEKPLLDILDYDKNFKERSKESRSWK